MFVAQDLALIGSLNRPVNLWIFTYLPHIHLVYMRQALIYADREPMKGKHSGGWIRARSSQVSAEYLYTLL